MLELIFTTNDMRVDECLQINKSLNSKSVVHIKW